MWKNHGSAVAFVVGALGPWAGLVQGSSLGGPAWNTYLPPQVDLFGRPQVHSAESQSAPAPSVYKANEAKSTHSEESVHAAQKANETNARQEVHSVESVVAQARSAQKAAEAKAAQQVHSAESEATRAQAEQKAAEAKAAQQVRSAESAATRARSEQKANEASATQKMRSAQSEAAHKISALKTAEAKEAQDFHSAESLVARAQAAQKAAEARAAHQVHSAESEATQARATQEANGAKATQEVHSAESQATQARSALKTAEVNAAQQVHSAESEATQAYAAQKANDAKAAQEVHSAESQATQARSALKIEEAKAAQQLRAAKSEGRIHSRFIIGFCGFATLFWLFLVKTWTGTAKKVAPASPNMEYNSNLQSLEQGLLKDDNVKPGSYGKSECFSWDVSELCKRQSFKVGESITSDWFTLKGLAGLRLRFYPAGDAGAGKSNLTTVLLEVPSGWRIAARLLVGDAPGYCEGEMPYTGPGSTWGLKGDCPRPLGEFTTVGVELLSATEMKDRQSFLMDAIVGA